jgi:hypothetical protein
LQSSKWRYKSGKSMMYFRDFAMSEIFYNFTFLGLDYV